ncbi:dienelactone hydrolase family protein [Bradyrhizobium sp.]|uniref:dienelactone hydrolase family protein n=1 Tax=Bradyrhizobium sp. TaxID=376 RepID=UPI0025B90F98|nr:dienelactone hydrolase family protein [Bradyrhizobium sp.]
MTSLARIAATAALLLSGSATACPAADSSDGRVVEIENPLASSQPLVGYLRQPRDAGPSPAAFLLHGCNGGWRRLDERWGPRIVSWGYVTLTVDRFGPSGLTSTCTSGPPASTVFDAYRALSFLLQQPFVDPDRVVVIGFSQGGLLALSSVERGAIERTSKEKFRAAVAFYPPCLGLKDSMTVPTLILVGELDDWTPANECRNLAAGRDDYGISRQAGLGVPIELAVYPGAYHGFDVPSLATPQQFLGHRLEFNEAARDQSVDALRKFLYATIGKEKLP